MIMKIWTRDLISRSSDRSTTRLQRSVDGKEKDEKWKNRCQENQVIRTGRPLWSRERVNGQWSEWRPTKKMKSKRRIAIRQTIAIECGQLEIRRTSRNKIQNEVALRGESEMETDDIAWRSKRSGNGEPSSGKKKKKRKKEKLAFDEARLMVWRKREREGWERAKWLRWWAWRAIESKSSRWSVKSFGGMDNEPSTGTEELERRRTTKVNELKTNKADKWWAELGCNRAKLRPPAPTD